MNVSRVLKIGALSCLGLLAILLVINFWIVSSTVDKIHYSTELVPKDRVGLILGTSRRTVQGHNNLYFDQRIEAAAKLFRLGLISRIIVSGDNRTQFYNEPKDMLNALKDKGIPETVVVLDPEGISTLDSVVRSQWVYGSEKILIITQDFHCYRALFIADHFGIDAQAFSADEKGRLSSTLATREVLARIKAVFDLYISGETPQYAPVK